MALKLEEAKQQNLVITDEDEPEISVDNIEVAQFIYRAFLFPYVPTE
jgi:hypothetical protein